MKPPTKNLTLGQRGALKSRAAMQVWSEIEQGYVDASTADNDINTTDNQYFDLVLNKFLGCFDKMDETGKTVLRCV